MRSNVRPQIHRRSALAGIICALPLTACDLISPIYSVRFRYQIDLTVEGKPVSGSSVFEVQWRRSFLEGLDATPRFLKKVWAEAPIIELGPGESRLAFCGRRSDWALALM
jgi:hypothetical protein